MRNIDSIDLAILKAIAAKQNISNREVESIIFLSRTQVLRRLRRLEERGLIIKRNSEPGKAYRYTISLEVVLEDIEAFQKRDSLSFWMEPHTNCHGSKTLLKLCMSLTISRV